MLQCRVSWCVCIYCCEANVTPTFTFSTLSEAEVQALASRIRITVQHLAVYFAYKNPPALSGLGVQPI